MSRSLNDNLELTQCDNEPITRLEHVQHFGFLIALSNDWIVSRVSANIEAFLDVAPEAMIGTYFDRWITAPAQHDIRNTMAALYSTGNERLFSVSMVAGKPPLDLSLHFQGESLILEGELSQTPDRLEAVTMVRAMIARLNGAKSLEAFHRDAARQVRAITGFDRVMIYRFGHDGAGEVIAESTRGGMESLLGLHYPASDIPKQARALYLRNPFRIIADIHAPVVPLLPAAGEMVEPLDLSFSVTRAVSPVHLEYLENMGVRASLSISIIVNGALWGLIACHHQSPRLPSFVMRTAAELFGNMYSLTLQGRIHDQQGEDEQRARSISDRLITAIAGDESLLSEPEWIQDMSRGMIDCDGVGVYRAGEVFRSGATPSSDNIVGLAAHLNVTSPSRVFATSSLQDVHPASAETASLAAGMLAIPISRVPRDYIMLFRRERMHQITWGGDPTKVVERSDDGMRLSPRKSFEAFVQLVRGRSMPFSHADLRIAESMRLAFIEVILRYSDSATEERRRADQRQELLIAELNHRVRNLLSLIRSLIKQTSYAQLDTAQYVDALSERIQSLARAHDRITQQNWGPTPLKALFVDEIAARGESARTRLQVEGSDVLLQPLAISTMALVVHELITNSCKYGALSEQGTVTVTMELKKDQGLFIKWRERGGPPVKAPIRRGFGSVIIERTVPFELNGSAEVRYVLSGLEVDFVIPQQHLVDAPGPPAGGGSHAAHDRPTASPAASGSRAQPLDGLRVLLVEDNMLIALEAEDMLKELGAAQVDTASSIDQANRFLAGGRYGFALLDVSVGTGTTFELASELRKIGTPYILASGYGDRLPLDKQPAVPAIVQKPYETSHLLHAIESAGMSRGQEARQA